MPKKKSRSKPAPSTYELIDWYFPEYVEFKPGSTDQAATVIHIRGLLDGRYIWQTTFVRERFPDGRRADWQIGNYQPGEKRDPVNSFSEALALARAQLEITPLPTWRMPF